MNEQKLSLTAGIVYVLAAAAVIFLFTVCGSGSSAVTVQTSEQGYKGRITIEVSVAGTKIKSAKLVSTEDSDFTKPAIETILAQAVKTGSAEKLDTVSGATFSSKATIAALKKAVEQAQSSSK